MMSAEKRPAKKRIRVAEELVAVVLRLPLSLHDRLRRRAERRGVTLNRYIVEKLSNKEE